MCAFDLSKLNTTAKSNDGAWLPLRDPGTFQVLLDDLGEPVQIQLAGVDSDAYRKAQRRVTNMRLNSRRGMAPKLTAEEMEAEALDILARCTMAWTGIVENGKVLECNYENARKLYSTYPWIKDQVDAFVNDRANFLQD